MRVGAKVEFRTGLVPVTGLRFFSERDMRRERISEGTCFKRREALHKATEAALMNLADRYFTHVKSSPSTLQSETRRSQSPKIVQNPSSSPSPDGHPKLKRTRYLQLIQQNPMTKFQLLRNWRQNTCRGC
ncbi:hypothetical protein RND81_10G036400 [Saponaria officinalis]|uniref:Uncharacterized protein n=1 Tax=Saponaria officinalis TaxID=3572 RepID=A0AAW1HXR0_SAPOF